MTATRTLAAFAAELEIGDLPPSATTMAKKLLLDGLGCLLVGIEGGPGQSAAATVRRFGGAPQATVYADGSKTSIRDAAFANGITLYSVGVNDIHKPSVSHPGGCIIPVLLALGEWRELRGADLLVAMAAGYEINGRVGRAIAPSHRERGFHPTGTCGVFGATAAAGRLLGLDAAQMASAFGLAGSQAAGLYEFHHDGTLTMIFHAGRAAQNGVESALLTLDGLTGPATILEGSKGFCRATSNAFDEASLTARLGEGFLIEETSFRPYFGCSSTIAASGALEAVLARKQPEVEVERVVVHCHPVVANDNAEPDPQTLLAARLSMNYNLALVLQRGQVLTGDLAEAELHDPAIRRWLPRVELLADPDMTRFGCALEVALADGRVEREENLTPRGEPDNPLTWDDVERKFRRMIEPLAGCRASARVIEAVADLETGGARRLVDALAGARPADRD